MKLARLFLFTLLYLFAANASATWNWNGTLKAKMQGDNRYSRYVDDYQVFGEVWGSFEAFDNKSWRASVDFVSRRHSNNGFQGDVYQAYVEKQIKPWDSTVKVGRFQRSDSLGFYSLDGGAWHYQMPKQGLSLNIYGGRPTRQEYVRSVSGNWLYGFNVMSHQQINWKNSILPVDTWLLRFGFQQFHNGHTSTRLTTGSTISGLFQYSFLHAYEFSFLSTLETHTSVFEEVFSSFLLDFTEQSRLRISYSLYEPKAPFPTFKERFYSDYYNGRQDLLRMSFNQSLSDQFSYHVDIKRAARNRGDDIGYGVDAGISSRHVRNLELNADFSMLEFGNSNNSYNLYLGSKYTLTTKTLLSLNLAYSLDTSPLYGQNKAAGTELKIRYKFLTDVFINLSGRYIANSRLNNEYQLGLQGTWYFDNFQPKATF